MWGSLPVWYLMVPVGEGSGLMRWAMLSGMLMVRGEICGCTGFTGDSGASRFAFLPLDRAVKVILMLVLGNLKVHLEENNTGKVSFWTGASGGFTPNRVRATGQEGRASSPVHIWAPPPNLQTQIRGGRGNRPVLRSQLSQVVRSC